MKEQNELAQQQSQDSDQSTQVTSEKTTKNGTASDMFIPLGISVLMLVVLGLWNYTFTNFGASRLPMNGNEMLILCFSVGLIVAVIKYTSQKLMGVEEFLDEAIEGSKSTLKGVFIIVLAIS